MAHGKFEFQDKGLSCLWLSIWTAVLTAITIGFLWPVAYARHNSDGSQGIRALMANS